MEFNSLIFPAPTSSYNPETIEQYSLDKILYIPRILDKNLQKELYEQQKTKISLPKEQETIPCLFLPYIQAPEGFYSNTLVIFFHGNAEDIGQAQEFLSCLRDQLVVNVISVEYPGYGIYKGQPSAERICEDAEIVYDFLTQILEIPQQRIIIFGRSIGTGPAVFLGSKKVPASVILMSPFYSFREVVKNVVGKLLCYLVADRFNNIECIDQFRSPLFLLHGKKDVLIPVEHSKRLYEKCLQEQIDCDFWFPSQMTHNSYNMLIDILIPIDNFLTKYKFKIELSSNQIIKIPYHYCFNSDINTDSQSSTQLDKSFLLSQQQFYEQLKASNYNYLQHQKQNDAHQTNCQLETLKNDGLFRKLFYKLIGNKDSEQNQNQQQ